MRQLTFALVVAILLSPAAARAGDYDDPPDPQPGANCQAGDVIVATTASNTFNPANVTIASGQTVCVRNSSSMPHNFHAPGVIRCSTSCASPYSASDPGSGPAGNWVVRLTYTEAGTLPYQCDAHAGLGMTGSITVTGGGGGGGPGNLAFTSGTYNSGETGNATITVRRAGGDDGAVSVEYATANGSATAGSDYTTRTGTLSWAAGQDGNKTFTVPILGDSTDEANETVLLSLSGPTGGATLGSPAAATLTIVDDDGGTAPPAPAAPSGLSAEPLSTSEIHLGWTDNSSNESQFLVEAKTLGGAFAQVGTSPAGTPTYTEGGLDPATYYIFRVRATNAGGSSAYSNEAAATTDGPTGPCVADADTLCFNGGRFRVELDWRFANGQSGPGQAVPLTDNSGAFYFLNPNNLEMLIKVLSGCPVNDRYWVFYAATTNVELTVTVTDTQNGSTKTYFNPLGTPAPPVQDTTAFDTCP